MKQPEIKTSNNGTYCGIFLAPVNHLERITNALKEMAKTDKELADAIEKGDKTFEGCDRFIRNRMADLAKEGGKREIVFDDNSIHTMARWYMVNPDACDVQNAPKATKKQESKSENKETKPQAETKINDKEVPLHSAPIISLFD